MSTMKKDNDVSMVAVLNAYALVKDQQAETLETIKAKAAELQSGKEAKAAITLDDDGLWSSVRQVVEAVDAATIDAGNLTLSKMVLEAVTEGLASGDAAKTLGQYVSTGRKVLEQVRAGRLAWATLPEAYKAVRTAMKPDHKKALDEKARELTKAIGRIKRHKLPAKAMEALNALIEACEVFAIEADASREKAKKANTAAKEIDELRQQHPAEPATVETVAANG